MSGADLSPSPLAPSFERMSEMKDSLYLFARLGEPDGDGWTLARELLSDEELLRESIRLYRERWSLDNRTSAIGFVGNFAWQPGGAALFLYAAERRVPDLSPDNVMLRLVGGHLEEVAFVSGHFAALANDPEASSATALFEDEEGLRNHFREGLESLMEPLIDGVRSATRVGKRTMWNRTADLLAQRLIHFGEAAGDKAWRSREAEKLVKSPGSPLDGATRFFFVESGGREEICLVRGCCCQAYKDPEYGYCGTCPLLSQEELEKRAVEAMSR